MPRELTDLTLTFHAEGPNAWLLSDDGDRDKAIWLPKSQVEIDDDSPSEGDSVEVTLPVWLAKKEGLI